MERGDDRALSPRPDHAAARDAVAGRTTAGALYSYIADWTAPGRWSVEVRTAGFSLAYSLATALFGGFTPAVATGLIHVLNNKAAPGFWMSFAALCGLLATLYLYRRGAAGVYRPMPAG